MAAAKHYLEISQWLDDVARQAGEYCDRLDPGRTREGSLVLSLDSVMTSASRAHYMFQAANNG